MAKLTCMGITSLDGYVSDRDGNFEWCVPDEQVHAFVNDFERTIGTYLYGRRLYDVMLGWESMDLAEQSPVMRDFAQIWRAADKVVYSTSLTSVSTARTRIETQFDPATVRELKNSSERNLTIGGPELAAQAIRAELVDEIHLLISPVVIGGGTPFLPTDLELDLELLTQRSFDNGVAYLAYRVV